ncbi:MAG: Flp pilus assembly protein CpaB [Bdellovibrionota bacterium]
MKRYMHNTIKQWLSKENIELPLIFHNPMLYPSLIFGFVLFALTLNVCKRTQQEAYLATFDKEVLAFGKDLQVGHVLEDGDLISIALPSEHLPARVIRYKDRDQFVGQRLLKPAKARELLFWDQLITEKQRKTSLKIPPGYRAISISVTDVTSVSYQIQSGDHVDLIVHFQDELQKPESFVLLQNVTVLATSTRGDLDEYSSITLMVLPEEVPVIMHGANSSGIQLSLRNPEDMEIFSKNPMVDSQQLYEMGQKNTLQQERKKKIEVLKGENIDFF